MSALTHLAIAATLFAAVAPAAAQSLTEAKAREIIAPWYGLFNSHDSPGPIRPSRASASSARHFVNPTRPSLTMP